MSQNKNVEMFQLLVIKTNFPNEQMGHESLNTYVFQLLGFHTILNLNCFHPPRNSYTCIDKHKL